MRSMHKGIGKVRLPALISEYARLDGRSRNTIAWYARNAREAGKMPTTKRGRGAAYMGVREAVNLILACNCAEDPKEGANAIERFRSYEPFVYNDILYNDIRGKEELDKIENCDIREIGLERDLGKALEKLIHLTPRLFETLDETLKYWRPERSVKERFIEITASYEIRLTLDKYSATISLSEEPFYVRDIPNFEIKNIVKIYYCAAGMKQLRKIQFEHTPNFRSVEVRLGFGFFLGLAKLFFEDSMQFPDELLPQSKDGGGDG